MFITFITKAGKMKYKTSMFMAGYYYQHLEVIIIIIIIIIIITAHYYSVGATVQHESWPLFCSFLIIERVGGTPWAGDQSIARPLPTQENTNTE
jgi:hypothetical protein